MRSLLTTICPQWKLKGHFKAGSFQYFWYFALKFKEVNPHLYPVNKSKPVRAYSRVNTNYSHTHGFGSPLALAWIWISFGFGSALALDKFWLWLSFGFSLTLNLSKLSFSKCCAILCSFSELKVLLKMLENKCLKI